MTTKTKTTLRGASGVKTARRLEPGTLQRRRQWINNKRQDDGRAGINQETQGDDQLCDQLEVDERLRVHCMTDSAGRSMGRMGGTLERWSVARW